MADKLAITTGRDVPYVIYWSVELDDYDDVGAVLGEESEADRVAYARRIKDSGEDGTDREYMVSVLAAMESPGVKHNGAVFYWETLREAQQALRFINLRLKVAKKEIPWPDWAIRAKAAGWTPPKNWKP